MEALVWSSNEIDFKSAVSGTTIHRKLAFTVGRDLTLYIEVYEIGPMIAALTDALELVCKQIAKDEQARAINERP